MCLIVIANEVHPQYKTILVANRDEFYERDTQAIHFWEESPNLLAGKDLVAGGTWIGVTKEGKLAAITNYRDPKRILDDAPSRGHLTKNYLQNDWEPLKYLMRMQFRAAEYNGFNLILGDKEDLFYYSNYERIIKKMDAGIFGLSNHLLDTPWPKVERAKQKIKDYLLTHQSLVISDLFALMKDTHQPEDEALPHTGVPLEWERILSSMFIKSPKYGTRSSTVILWDYSDHITMADRVYDTNEDTYKDQVFELGIK
ncbi:MAG: NRDE family protein [Thermonemataceae bacterium]